MKHEYEISGKKVYFDELWDRFEDSRGMEAIHHELYIYMDYLWEGFYKLLGVESKVRVDGVKYIVVTYDDLRNKEVSQRSYDNEDFEKSDVIIVAKSSEVVGIIENQYQR